MSEKDMISDALQRMNKELTSYAEMIAQSDDYDFRMVLRQIRNDTEKSQYELYTLAKNMAYFQPVQKASEDDINNVKASFDS